jgi:peptidoglycan L-alanyl-D-glutamate endopeptidase CwlK
MPKFSKKSQERLETANHLLQLICNLAIKETDFVVICGHRTKEEQDAAYKAGNSKLKFPKSKHNSLPSRAVDLAPCKIVNGKTIIDWNDRQRFIDLSKIILRIAKEKNIPIRWGGDFNMDGNKTTNDAWDLPHYELTI